jgi:hypothetical protein
MSNLFEGLGISESQINSNMTMKAINAIGKHVPIYADKTNTYFGHSGPTGCTGSHNVFVGSQITGVEGLTGAVVLGANVAGATAKSGSVLVGENCIPVQGHSGQALFCIGGTGAMPDVISGASGPAVNAYSHIIIGYKGQAYRLLCVPDY